ncbi:MAG: hypothetical protein ACRCXZ_07040 [Patescibacteria group bacterium]
MNSIKTIHSLQDLSKIANHSIDEFFLYIGYNSPFKLYNEGDSKDCLNLILPEYVLFLCKQLILKFSDTSTYLEEIKAILESQDLNSPRLLIDQDSLIFILKHLQNSTKSQISYEILQQLWIGYFKLPDPKNKYQPIRDLFASTTKALATKLLKDESISPMLKYEISDFAQYSGVQEELLVRARFVSEQDGTAIKYWTNKVNTHPNSLNYAGLYNAYIKTSYDFENPTRFTTLANQLLVDHPEIESLV